MLWTPKISMFSRKVNKKRIDDTGYSVYERMLTYDGPEIYSESGILHFKLVTHSLSSIYSGLVPVKSTGVADIMKDLIYKIQQHVYFISNKAMDITRAVAFFKLDRNKKVIFLFCTSMRLKQTPFDEERQTIVKLGSNLTTIPNFQPQVSYSRKRPVELIRTETCVMCNRMLISNELVKTTYRLVIELNKQARKTNERPNKIVVDCSKEKGAKRAFVNPGMHKKVPFLIKKIHPKLGVDEYKQLKREESFMQRELFVCNWCFLLMTKNQRVAGGSLLVKQSQVPLYNFENPKKVFIDKEIKGKVTDLNWKFIEDLKKFKADQFNFGKSRVVEPNELQEQNKTASGFLRHWIPSKDLKKTARSTSSLGFLSTSTKRGMNLSQNDIPVNEMSAKDKKPRNSLSGSTTCLGTETLRRFMVNQALDEVHKELDSSEFETKLRPLTSLNEKGVFAKTRHQRNSSQPFLGMNYFKNYIFPKEEEEDDEFSLRQNINNFFFNPVNSQNEINDKDFSDFYLKRNSAASTFLPEKSLKQESFSSKSFHLKKM